MGLLLSLFKGIKSMFAKESKDAPIPIIEGEVGFNMDYRKPGDESHYIRVNQQPSIGNLKRIAY